MLNLPAYLDRIGYAGPTDPSAQTLRGLHRAHMLTVPFENLDIHIGRPITCDESRFLYKIVDERRGGFCYELNGAFAALLRALGFHVTLLSARVTRANGSDGPEFDHLTLRVDFRAPANQVISPEKLHPDRSTESDNAAIHDAESRDASWLADVGFGDSFLEPLRMVANFEQRQSGRIYRVSERSIGGENTLRMEVMSGETWKPQYSFTLQPRELCDFAGMCQYYQTSPESHFTRQRICSMATPEGRITLSGFKLIQTCAGRKVEREVSGEAEWNASLRQWFGVNLPSAA